MGVVCASLLLRRAAGALLPHLHHRPRHAVHRGRRDDVVRRPGRGRRPDARLPARSTSPPDDPLFDADDDEVRAEFLPYLQRHVPHAPRRRRARLPGLAGAAGVRRAHARLLGDACRRSTTSVPGLHLVGSAQLPFATLNVNDTLVDSWRSSDPMKPIGLAVARPRQPVVVPDDPRRRGLGRLRLATSTCWCRSCSSSSAAGAADHVLRGRPGRRPRRATRRPSGHRRGRPRDRQPHLPPPALAPPLLRATRSTTSSTGPRRPSKPSPASAPSGFRGPGYSLSADVLRVLVDRGYRVRLLHPAHGDRAAGPQVLLPLGQALAPSSAPSARYLFGELRGRACAR